MPFIGQGNVRTTRRGAQTLSGQPVSVEEEEAERQRKAQQTATRGGPQAPPEGTKLGASAVRDGQFTQRDNVTQRPGQTASSSFAGLDPEVAAWVDGLMDPIDTQAAEDLARQNSEAALGRGKANLEARGGMAGMGLAGGQIAMGADLERQSGTDLANQILGIQQGARAENLQRGAVGAEFVDRGMVRQQDQQFTDDVLAQMGYVRDENGHLVPDGSTDTDYSGGEEFEGVPFGDGLMSMFDTPVGAYTSATGHNVVVYERGDGTRYQVVED